MKTFQATLFLVLATGIHLAAASLRHGPCKLNPAEYGIGKWVPNIDFETIQGKKGTLSNFGQKKAEELDKDQDRPQVAESLTLVLPTHTERRRHSDGDFE